VIAEHGDVILQQGYGRVAGAEEPITVETPFWIASITKQFTASAVLELVEEGKLALEDTIGASFRSVPASRSATTLGQLLTHTAGLQQNYVADGIIDRDAAVQAVLSQPLTDSLGTGFSYSNDAYSLLAAVVEVASGDSFETFVHDKLLVPAGLRHTGFWGPDDHPRVVPIRGRMDERLRRPNWGYRGGVGMYSCAADLYRWNRALEADKVLTGASRRALQSSHVQRGATGVGYGWFVSTTPRGTTSIWTRGYEDFGHGAVLATYPDDEVVIVVVSNAGDRNGVPVSHHIAEALGELVGVR
jgi:CubicO group peptidase (beta-lactamase class C family)